jgi:hypothetical protein
MMLLEKRPIRFKLNKVKSIEAIDFIASEWKGITQYFVCKTFYFSDKEHFLDWGRPISGDYYVAMSHGPVPSRIYELLKPDSGEEDDWLELFDRYLSTEKKGKLTHVYSKKVCERKLLSRTDESILRSWTDHFLKLPEKDRFSEVERLAHLEKSWVKARDLPGNAPEMDLSYWGEEAGLNEDMFRQLVLENSKFVAAI